MHMADTPTAVAVPTFSGARARHDYAGRTAWGLKPTITRLMREGVRRHADLAHALNEVAGPSPAGRPWDASSVGRVLRRLGLGREAVAREDAEAISDQVEELWGRFIRTPPQLAIALNRQAVPCAGGGHWTAARVRTLLNRLAGDWMGDSAGPLRRGDSVPLAPGLPEVEAIVAVVEASPVSRIEPAPRRRAIRSS